MTTQYLRDLKEATEKLTQWDSSGKAFGHFEEIEKKATTKSDADRIYEFFCFLKILDDLRVNYNVELKAPTKKKVFPKAPANKKGYAYFVLKHKSKVNNEFQFCLGTKIKLSDTPDTEIAPDISLQKINSPIDSNPTEDMIELIMDAKFKYDNTKALPSKEIHTLMQLVEVFKTHDAVNSVLDLNSLTSLKGNCLLTNGKGLPHQGPYCKKYHVKQVENFDITGTFNVIG